MKALLRKIRQILRDRKVRRFFTRLISTVGAVVVFVTTYALVLPAITLEINAGCGIEAHQHDDSCWTEVLTCEKEESEGHHHDASCYEKVLTCGKEYHVHSSACYKEDAVSAVAESSSVAASNGTTSTATGASTGSAAAVEDDFAYGTENAGTGTTEDAAAASTTADKEDDAYVPPLEPLNFDAVLNNKTGIYYYHIPYHIPDAADGTAETVEDSSMIPAEEWNRINSSTELGKEDLLRVYLAYTVPAGSLNASNPIARYRLPENLHVSDDQVKAINENVNGIAGQYVNLDNLEILDTDMYYASLGAEAVEGDREPDEDPDEYLYDLVKSGREGVEYISATVQIENVYSEENGEYQGQDLVFTFTPYSIEKNQHEYDKNGQPTKAGEKISGWIALDFNMSQVDLADESGDTQTAEITFSVEDRDLGTKEISTKLTVVDESAEDEASEAADKAGTDESEEFAADETGKSVDDFSEDSGIDSTEDAAAYATEESTATEESAATDETAGEAAAADEAEGDSAYTSGTLTASGDGYKITLDYTEEAQIPEDASLSVREITAETDKEAYEACLEQAKARIVDDSNEKATVDETASRFFDIEIVVADENGGQQKIEPKAAVSVNIQLDTVTPTAAETADQDQSQVPASLGLHLKVRLKFFQVLILDGSYRSSLLCLRHIVSQRLLLRDFR